MKERLKKYLSREKYLIIFITAIAVFAYGYMMFNYALTGDEERDVVLGTNYTSKFELPLGRYGQWLFRLIFMEGMTLTPGYGDMLAVLFLAVSAIVWCSNLELLYKEKKLSTVAKCIFCGIYMTVPYASASVMCYTFLNASSMLAILAAAFAIRFIILSFEEERKKGLLYLGIAVLLEAHALSTYQAHASDIILGSVICIFTCTYARNDLKVKDIGLKILRYVAVFVIAFIIYEIISHIIGLNGYTDAFIKWGTDSFGDLINALVTSIGAIYDKEKTVGAAYLSWTVNIFYLSVILNFIINFKQIAQKVLYILVALLVFPAAYAVSIALGGMTHYATHTAVLLMAGFMWFHVISTLNKKYLYEILVCLAFFFILRQVDLDSRIHYGQRLMAELDMELGYELASDICEVAGTKNVKKPVVVVGKYRHSSPMIIEVGMAGRSIFLRKNDYKLYYFRYLGFNFKAPDAEQIIEAEAIAKELPVWPAEGSVIETDELIIVHLSQNY